MKNIILLSLITINVLHAQMSMAEKRKILEEKLFAKMSKNKAQSKEFYLPLKVNDILQDEVFVKIDNKENILLTEDTVKYLRSLMKEEFQSQYVVQIDSNGFTPLKALEQMGIKTEYDRKNILLKVFLPVNLKKASLVNFNRSGRARDVNGSVLPTNYSGGMNFYLNQQYNKNGSNGFEKNAFNLSSDVHLNVHGFVLEGRLQYNDEENEVTKGRFRVVTDDVENQLRYQAGDISLPAHDRMSFVNALGVGVEKIWNIGSGYTQNITRINSHEFFIQNRSRVEIYVNDRYRNALNLAGGTHNLFDLNLPSGLNRVRLVVIENGGKIETIEFNDFSYSEVLKKGLARYGAGVGIESEQLENEWIYKKQRRVASAYVEYGLLDSVTVETGFQTGEEYLAGSAELLIGTNFGLFNPYVVSSKSEDAVGYKKGLDYRTNLGEVTINLGYEEIDAKYAILGNSQSQASTLYRGSLYSQVGMGVSMGVSASSYDRDDENEDKYGVVLRKNFGALSTELNLDQITKEGQTDDTQIYATIDYRFGNRYNARYVSYLSDQKHQLNLRRNAEGRYGVNSDLQFESNKQATNYNVRADMNNEKFRIDASYLLSDIKSNAQKNETIGLQMATGFVFAGTTVTLTAPINSSFVIVDNDDKLETSLGLNGYHEVDEFVYDTYAIDVSDYSERELFIDESALDFGVDLRDSKQKFLTNYKTGAIMDVAVENFYSIKGSFYEQETRKPLVHKAFKIFNAETGERSTSFTNDKGEFIINHVGVGAFNITFTKEREYTGVARHQFFIKEGEEESLMDMGKVYIEMPEKEEVKKHLVYNKKSKKSVSQVVQNVLKNIYFESNSYAITGNEEEKLNKLSKVLNQYKELKIDIIGHTDKKGSEEYNMELSHRRANSVKEYLLAQGVNSTQLNTLGMGATKAIYLTDEDNRWAEFTNEVVFQVR
ncbi:MAG: Outer membrane protein [uncultured Sulfurovum sp.]|uniref:Outer membrane protein n=1 Tax=uncultured Sulfurovum sp. TaxID=269237 RepID=A0A6S6S1U7_9BACT|nr:MAG: Outer membrane protein [uncultured Sulfurovum sp.]